MHRPASNDSSLSEAPNTVIGSVHVDVPYLMGFEWHVRGMRMTDPLPVRSVLSGGHASRLRGRGLNFDEIRAYVPGDDIRHIDWKASMRLGRALIRAYTEERDRPVTVVVDQRIGMHFGSRRAFKSVVAAEVAAMAVWMGFSNGDRVGGMAFDDASIVRVKSLRSRRNIARLFGTVVTMNGQLCADSPARSNYRQLNDALGQLLHTSPHDHLIVIASDFAGADEHTQALLRQLRTHNDVVAALVYDPLWQHVQNPATLVVSEGLLQVELQIERERVRVPVSEFFKGRTAQVAELLRRSNVPWLPVSTAEPAIDQIRHLLGARRQSHAARREPVHAGGGL
ncbi:DUF58 domain-containing protein [Pandoraea norimbergensis]|uniref:MoxR protein n=1 Tax=Pandoraea norimbergensis TaxID=93219 RepID=A0ABN4JMW0_9BURK|nr:DUF58 domain-containing protein [Pandoraea norimbergensis]ALS61766.1 MoxR protein [Pandoraea norimbergensis]